jgi:predicted DNA-binding transcriptional regulator AlpA
MVRMSKVLAEQNDQYKILVGLESDIAYLMERVKALEAARPPPKERLLNQESAAALIGVKPTTLATWRHERKGPHYRKIGRSVYYRAADIDAWLDEQAVVPIPKDTA